MIDSLKNRAVNDRQSQKEQQAIVNCKNSTTIDKQSQNRAATRISIDTPTNRAWSAIDKQYEK